MIDSDAALGLMEPDPMSKGKDGKKAEKPRQEIIVVYKADGQTAGPFKEWLEGLADHIGAPVTVTLDMALKELASKHKYSKSMPKRLVR